MTLYRGVIPIHCDITTNDREGYQQALMSVTSTGAIGLGDRVIVTSGDITGTGGMTNTLKILQVKGA